MMHRSISAYAVYNGLAEFAARRRRINLNHFLRRRVRRRKYSSVRQCADRQPPAGDRARSGLQSFAGKSNDFPAGKKNDASRRHFFMFDWDYKPGSVIDSHLSRRSVAAALKPPPRKRPGRPYASSTVLHRIEFTAPQCSHAAGELLPRLSTLTPRAGRYFSVALFLKSPSAGVTRYPCPVVPGLSSHGRFSAQMRGCPSQSCLFYFILAEMSNGLQNLSRADIIWE